MANFFEYSKRTPSIPAGGTYTFALTAGPSHIVVLTRNVTFTGLLLEADVYRGATISGGTADPVYALDTSIGDVSEVVMKSGVTVSNTGTKISATSYYQGSIGNGQTVVGTFAPSGGAGVRRLRPADTSILTFTNTDANPQTVDFYLRWYEGPEFNPPGA